MHEWFYFSCLKQRCGESGFRQFAQLDTHKLEYICAKKSNTAQSTHVHASNVSVPCTPGQGIKDEIPDTTQFYST